MKKKIIQLILIERFRLGVSLSQVREMLDSGHAPTPLAASEFNAMSGRMEVLLWALKEICGDQFVSTVETLGFRPDDEDIKNTVKLDELLEKFAPFCGDLAASALKTREENPAL